MISHHRFNFFEIIIYTIASVGAGTIATVLTSGIPALQIGTGTTSLNMTNFLAIGAGVVFGLGVAYGAYRVQVNELNKVAKENSLLNEEDLIVKKLNTMKSIKTIRAASVKSSKTSSYLRPAETGSSISPFSSKYWS